MGSETGKNRKGSCTQTELKRAQERHKTIHCFCWSHSSWEKVEEGGRGCTYVCLCVSCLSGREVLYGEAVNLCEAVKSHKETIKTFKGILNRALWAFLLSGVCLCVNTSQAAFLKPSLRAVCFCPDGPLVHKLYMYPNGTNWTECLQFGDATLFAQGHYGVIYVCSRVGDIHHATRMWGGLCFTYQTVHAVQCVIGIVQGVGQLVHAVIGLTVAIETHTHCDAAQRRGTGGQVSTAQQQHCLPCKSNMSFSITEFKVCSKSSIQKKNKIRITT